MAHSPWNVSMLELSRGHTRSSECESSFTAAGPQISLLGQGHFIITLIRKKILIPSWAGATVCVEFGRSLHVHVGFLWVLGFPLTSQKCALEVNYV